MQETGSLLKSSGGESIANNKSKSDWSTSFIGNFSVKYRELRKYFFEKFRKDGFSDAESERISIKLALLNTELSITNYDILEELNN